jgi:hypothetical protein
VSSTDEPDALPGLDGSEVAALQPVGPLELAVRKSVQAAALDDRDVAAGELAAQAARFVDLSAKRRDPFAGAATVRECREQLVRLRLDPTARLGNDAGELARFLEQLAEPDPVEHDGGATS